MRGGRRRQLVAHDVREIDPAAFQHIALLDQPGEAAAAFRALPLILPERLAIDLFQAFDDELLQFEEEFLDLLLLNRPSAG
jgi:hypothetical protein